jgi:hypothetical protein
MTSNQILVSSTTSTPSADRSGGSGRTISLSTATGWPAPTSRPRGTSFAEMFRHPPAARSFLSWRQPHEGPDIVALRLGHLRPRLHYSRWVCSVTDHRSQRHEDEDPDQSRPHPLRSAPRHLDSERSHEGEDEDQSWTHPLRSTPRYLDSERSHEGEDADQSRTHYLHSAPRRLDGGKLSDRHVSAFALLSRRNSKRAAPRTSSAVLPPAATARLPARGDARGRSGRAWPRGVAPLRASSADGARASHRRRPSRLSGRCSVLRECRRRRP